MSLQNVNCLPEKPDPITLEGHYVCLQPLIIARDAQALFSVSNGSPIQLGNKSVDTYDADAFIWRYLFEGPFENLNDFIVSLQRQIHASNALCLCISDRLAGKQIGVANFMNNSPIHLKIELGGISV